MTSPDASPRPWFFLAGAPKCGTTALATYLATHPDVLFSDPKEPKYFNTDFRADHRGALTPDEYARCFRRRTDQRAPRAVGEGTVWYLYSKAAVPNILAYEPAARFILMFRNPVEMVRSLHAQFVYGGYETLDRLEDAWDAQAARVRGRRIPWTCPEPKILQYGEVARLGTQLQSLYDRVPCRRVLVLLLEDLVADPRRTYERALEFLDLEPDGREEFPVVNRSRRVIVRPVARVLHLAKWVKRALGIRSSLGVWRAVSPLISRADAGRPLSVDLREKLGQFFDPEVRLLSEILQRDLSHWMDVRSGASGARGRHASP